MGRYRNVSFLAAAIFLQILGLAVQVKRSAENQSTRLIRVWAVSAITPLEKGLVRIQGGASDIWRNYFYLRGVRQENRELRDQIEQLQLDQVRLQQDADQAHRLQALLGFKEQFIAKTLPAQVIGSSGSEQSRTVYIDKGSRDGIQLDMAVISATGVVGKVINVYRSTSQVLLINDQQSGVGAILEQSRLQGILKGKSSGQLIIDKIMADEEVKPGDRVLTSGCDQIFPKGLTIGSIEKISKGPEFLQISVKPSAALSRLEEVLVIVKKEEREPVSTATSGRPSDILAERLPSVPDKPASPSASGARSTTQALAPRNAASIHSVAAAGPGSELASAPGKPAAAASGTQVANGFNSVSGTAGSKTLAASSTWTPASKTKLQPSATSKPASDATSAQPQSNPSGDAPQ